MAEGRPCADDRAGGGELHRRAARLVTSPATETVRRAPEIVTFGCRLNAYESEVMADLAADAGIDDLVIVNTCAVTADAQRQARHALRRTQPEPPAGTVVLPRRA